MRPIFPQKCSLFFFHVKFHYFFPHKYSLRQREQQIQVLQGHTTYLCERFRAVGCMDLPLSGFLFFLLLALLPTYPQTLDLSLSLTPPTEKNRAALIPAVFLEEANSQAQPTCRRSLLLSEEAVPYGPLSRCLFTLPLHYEMYSELLHGHIISADTTAPPAMDVWKQLAGS